MTEKQINKNIEYRIIADDGTEKILLSNQSLFNDTKKNVIRLEDIFQYSDDVNAALYRISEQAHIAEDMMQFFTEIHRIIATLTYAENFFIALYDEDEQSMSFPYIIDVKNSNIGTEELAKMPLEILKKTLTGYMLNTREMLHLDTELMNSLAASGEVNLVGATSHQWLGFPLKKANIF